MKGSGKAENPASVVASSNERDVDMESLNAALHELGMLSAITESRREYLRETLKTHSRSSSALSVTAASSSIRQLPAMSDSLCVLHMDSNYVTDLRLKVACDVAAGEATEDESCCVVTARKWPPPRSRHFSKPYSVPSCAADARLRRRNWARRSHHNLPDGESSSSLSSKDHNFHLGNRSNPGSPEKAALGYRSCTSREYTVLLPPPPPAPASSSQMNNIGSSLMRSRSLDDIETIQVVGASLRSSEEALKSSTRLDIDNVSARLGHLHVN